MLNKHWPRDPRNHASDGVDGFETTRIQGKLLETKLLASGDGPQLRDGISTYEVETTGASTKLKRPELRADS